MLIEGARVVPLKFAFEDCGLFLRVQFLEIFFLWNLKGIAYIIFLAANASQTYYFDQYLLFLCYISITDGILHHV